MICNICEKESVCKLIDGSDVVKCAEFLGIKETDYKMTSDDCISRAEAIKAIRNYNATIVVSRTIGKSQLVDIVDSINKVQEKMISELPPVTPKPMQVDLEGDGYADGELVYDYGKCPKCGWDFEYGDKDWEEPYCCHCGQRLHWFESEDKE